MYVYTCAARQKEVCMLFQKVSSTTKSKHTHKYVVWLLILFRSLLTTYFLIDVEKNMNK